MGRHALSRRSQVLRRSHRGQRFTPPLGLQTPALPPPRRVSTEPTPGRCTGALRSGTRAKPPRSVTAIRMSAPRRYSPCSTRGFGSGCTQWRKVPPVPASDGLSYLHPHQSHRVFRCILLRRLRDVRGNGHTLLRLRCSSTPPTSGSHLGKVLLPGDVLQFLEKFWVVMPDGKGAVTSRGWTPGSYYTPCRVWDDTPHPWKNRSSSKRRAEPRRTGLHDRFPNAGLTSSC